MTFFLVQILLILDKFYLFLRKIVILNENYIFDQNPGIKIKFRVQQNKKIHISKLSKKSDKNVSK